MLIENVQISMSKKAFTKLSYEAKDAINSWESMNWTDGPLEKAFKENNNIAQEISEAFRPIRELLLKKGNTIKLFRGVSKGHESFTAKKFLESWTDDKKVAEIFSGWRTIFGDSLIKPPILQKDIEDAIKRFEKTGFTKFRNKIYKSGEEFEYYGKSTKEMHIYNSRKNHITSATVDDLRGFLEDDKEYIDDYNKKILEGGEVLVKNIPVNSIIWITNNLNSKEYIVQRNKI